jgi:hypothetical protein
VPFATVTVTRVDVPNFLGFLNTDDEGRYTADAVAGDYWLTFNSERGTQWATGRSTATQADPVTIAAGATTTHDETLAPLGSVTVTAVDTKTGSPLSEFCVSVEQVFECAATGSLTVDLLPGRHSVFAFVQGTTYVNTDAVVEVTSGVTTSLNLEFTRAATVATTIVDRQSGAPVFGACLELVSIERPTSLGNSELRCSDEAGAVTLDRVRPGAYKAFTWIFNGEHGHQWVGLSGGVGEFEKARNIRLGPGQALTLPPIRLDQAGGDITGTVTDELTGDPISQGGFVSLSSFNSGVGPGQGNYEVGAGGRYTISGLGPYPWALLFEAPSYAAEWSGNAVVRSRAKPVQVLPGQPVTYDTALRRGVTVSGTVTDANGTQAHVARITFHSVDSRDEIGVGDIWELSPDQYTAQVNGRQRVRVSYFARVGLQDYVGFVGGTGFEDATTFAIPTSGSLTINIIATQPNP